MNIHRARQPDPSFARTTALMVNIFSMTTEAVDPRTLLSEREVRGQLHLRFRPKWDVSPGILAREKKSVKDESFKAFKSHNYCVFACKLLAGLLAWLVEELRLPIDVEEVEIHGVYEIKPVVCIESSTGRRRRIADVHTVFKITSPNDNGEGVYIDPSAPQYLRPAGVYPVRGYPAYPDEEVKVPIEFFSLGYNYSQHLNSVHENEASSSRSRTLRIEFRTEAIVRTVNNRVYQKMTGCAWKDVIRGGNDDKWGALEHDILSSVKADLDVLVNYLDNKYIPGNLDRNTHWKALAKSCMGTGHAKVMESLERALGLEVTRHQLS
ncbi:uncharacterized protein J4E79_004762 [Alternaria viburni]|uniref:uncharacterized protein n=1 Tax=Alternaria viburni TaxID=566460 RepID=UPI0020C56D04|nr:uncharacterized protein J4E79_004762 [Alternaria viburni]KAI4662472.1 hypothetical protein J4E79_004762 [Alternaria viburni]